jgi:hypothetical protein
MRNPPEQEAGFDFVAGARFPVRTPGSDSRFGSETSSKPSLDGADRALLDYLVDKALEIFFPPRRLAMAMLNQAAL